MNEATRFYFDFYFDFVGLPTGSGAVEPQPQRVLDPSRTCMGLICNWQPALATPSPHR